ncbi:hypothetical protein [Pseudarthrobacter sp. H2]|uniref:hypothetical protein n=1 Tax=Pseudarthrobacter sp. H2 TaxID=3418415 RepID=UPI003CEA71ED
MLRRFLDGGRVDAGVFSLRPDYRAVLLAAEGLVPGTTPIPGEVVWCDDTGVTCRRWNWRQGRRTQLREDTTAALFILDALEPMTAEALGAAAEDLSAHLARLGPDVRVVRRLMAAGTTIEEGD